MRFFSLLAIFGLVLVAFNTAAQAGAKPALFGWALPMWHPGHFDEMDFERRLAHEGRMPINTQWDNDQWSPKDWIDDRGSAEAVMNGFYRAGIVTDQDEDDGIPVLEVGQKFMRLSALEQRRVTKFVDYAFGITNASEYGMYKIVHEPTCQEIGVYTRYGLQLQ